MRLFWLATLVALCGCEPPPAAKPRDLSGEVARLQHELAGIRSELDLVTAKLAIYRKAMSIVESDLYELSQEKYSTSQAGQFHNADQLAKRLRELDAIGKPVTPSSSPNR